MTFTGVDQTTPLGTCVNSAADEPSPMEVVVTSAAGELVFDVTSGEDTTFTVVGGQDERWNISPGSKIRGAASTKPGAGSVTMSWTLGTPTHHIMTAVPIKPNLSDVTVSSTGSQTSSLAAPSTDFYVGGTFVITENTSSRNVTNIKITENGTVDALNDLSNVRLYYETAADCSVASFSGFPSPTESLFGTATTFDGVDGSASFTGSVAISTSSEMCVYVVLDAGAGASGESGAWHLPTPCHGRFPPRCRLSCVPCIAESHQHTAQKKCAPPAASPRRATGSEPD